MARSARMEASVCQAERSTLIIAIVIVHGNLATRTKTNSRSNNTTLSSGGC